TGFRWCRIFRPTRSRTAAHARRRVESARSRSSSSLSITSLISGATRSARATYRREHRIKRVAIQSRIGQADRRLDPLDARHKFQKFTTGLFLLPLGFRFAECIHLGGVYAPCLPVPDIACPAVRPTERPRGAANPF